MAHIIGESTQITGNLDVTGSITGSIARSNIALETKVLEIPLTSLRVWDAFQTTLPSVGASDDIGLTAGTFGTAQPYLRSQDLNAAGAITTEYARGKVTLPLEFVSYASVYFRLCAGMLTSVAATSATVDFEAYLCSRTASTISGSDLVTTSATSVNSTTLSDKDFTVNSAALVGGSVLDFRLAFAATSATASSHFLIATHLELVFTVRQ